MTAPRTVRLPYRPRDVFKPYHYRPQRFAALVAHRRAGKTVSCVNDLIRQAILLPPRAMAPGRFGYIAPLLNQAKDAAWVYLKTFAAPVIAETNESDLYVELISGSRIRIYGADNPDRIRGAYFDGVVLDEYADMRPSVWGEIVRPMLADYQGGATFIGTPKGRNAFYSIVDRARLETDRWFHATLRASETGLLPQAELDDARKDMTPEQYAQEFECSFDAAILGAYYGREIAEAERQGRITDAVPIEDDLPVHTAWDLGMGDSTAIWWFQAIGDEVRILDSYEAHGQPLSHYAGVVHSKPYKLGKAYVPHDARVRELGTGRTRVEVLKDLGLNPVLVPAHKVEDGINAARMGLSRMWFHESRTREALEALRQYRTEYDEKTRAFKNTPKHDWTSHYADAFRYLAMTWREQVRPQPEPTKPPVKGIGQWTIEEAWNLGSGAGSRRL